MDVGEACLFEHGAEGFFRPELDVAVVPESGEVFVELAGEREREIFEIAVIGRGEDEQAGRLEQRVSVAEEGTRVVEVFDDLGADDDVDLADALKYVASGRGGVGEEEFDGGKGAFGEVDAGGREV